MKKEEKIEEAKRMRKELFLKKRDVHHMEYISDYRGVQWRGYGVKRETTADFIYNDTSKNRAIGLLRDGEEGLKILVRPQVFKAVVACYEAVLKK